MVFITVLRQVVVLFILIFVGVILSKVNIINEKSIKSLTDITLTAVIPCVIIKSFIRKFDAKTLKYVLLSFLFAAIVHIIFILLAKLCIKDKDEARKSVLRFGSIFGNCGFMSLPIQEAILGEKGVIYCASFIAIFNLFSWTYGIVLMSGDKKEMSPKKVFINPGVIGLIIGLLIFVSQIKVPQVVSLPIGYLAALNTPFPMLIIGYHLSKSNILSAVKDKKLLFASVCRVLLFPAVAVGVLLLIGVRGDLLLSMAISASSPVAAYTTMFSYKYGRATDLSVNMVAVSTLMSLFTMPVLSALVKFIGK